MNTHPKLIIVLAALALSACATNPTGPSNMALPGTGKDFNRFRADDLSCRDFALTQIGGKTVNQQYNASLATTTAVGTVVGAASVPQQAVAKARPSARAWAPCQAVRLAAIPPP